MAERTVRPGSRPLSRFVTDDGAARISGRFTFAVDRRVEGAVHACTVRSSVPHGRIERVSVDDALALPGVFGVVTGADVRDDPSVANTHGENRPDQPILAFDKVRYVGEPVAVVVAETRAIAEEAARLVTVDIAELDFVLTHEEAARPGAPVVHDEWPGNDCGSWTLRHGDAEAAMAGAAVVHTATYRSPTANHVPMEPHVATASWLPDGSLEVWTGTQSPYVVRKRLAGIFGLAEERVRIRGDNLGGAFGGKLDLRLEGLVAVAARVVGRPVRMELRREEVFVTCAKHAATVTITTGADRQGRLVARIIDLVYNAGAYATSTPRATRTGMIRSPGPYAIPNVLVRSSGHYTNTVPTGPFRGAMTTQVCWAHESALDELAAQLGMDPVEIRQLNVLRDGSVYATGEAMQDMRYTDLITAAAGGVGWDEPRQLPRERHLRRGKGIAVVIKSARTPSRSEARLLLDAEGRLTVRVSSAEMGQGAHPAMAALVAGELHVPATDIAVSHIDTDVTPFDTTTSSSRTTLMMGLAVEDSAADLRRQIDELVLGWWGAQAAPLVHENSCVRPSASPGPALSYRDVLDKAGLSELVGKGSYSTPEGLGQLDPETAQGLHTVSWHQGAVAVEVEVDLETGQVRLLRAHGAAYAGRAVDEHRIRQQTEGGIIFALGQAVMEEVLFDAGQVSNANLSDYQIPSILDVPRSLGSTTLTDPDPHAHPHGVGENAVPPLAPAIGNAVFAATGVRVRDLPVTAEKVLRGIHALGVERGGPA